MTTGLILVILGVVIAVGIVIKIANPKAFDKSSVTFKDNNKE